MTVEATNAQTYQTYTSIVADSNHEDSRSARRLGWVIALLIATGFAAHLAWGVTAGLLMAAVASRK